MTILDMIERAEDLRPGGCSERDLLRWLSTLDARVALEILGTHKGGDGASFVPYDSETDPTTALLVPPPFDAVYERYIEAQIDYERGEMTRYNNAAAAFNEAFAAYAAHYHRTHAPRRVSLRFF